ncbi:MAG: response regulator transcription factor [Ruminococcus sp.]|nr:response regulator transcription factor [Ruminococcus sp.]
MNIAVCDDDLNIANLILENVKNLIDKHNDRNITFDYYVFNNPTELIQKHNEITFDVVFLDIDMPQVGGFDVAEKLYIHYRDVFIIYVTSYAKYAIDSIKHRVYRFILKSNLKELEDSIIHLLDDLTLLNVNYKFSYKDDYYNIPTKSILYCESIRNNVIIHTENGDYKQKTSIKKMIKHLPKTFARCHTSYIVNLLKIDRIKSDYVLLSNGDTIPIGRVYKRDLIEKYVEVW